MNFLKSSIRIVFFFGILFLLFSISTQSAFSAQVTLAWDANEEDDLAGYRVYYGTLSRNYQYSVDAGNNTTFTVSDLDDGKTYYCAVTAYDTQNNESEFSGELTYTVPGAGGVGDISSDTVYEDTSGTVYEDAEDETTDGWEVYDNISGRAEITNVFDEDRQSRVIKLSGNGFWDGYRLNKADGSNWLNENQFIIQWDMNYSESFYVYLDVETDHGQRHIYYTPVDYDSLGDGAGVHHGLGRDVIDGRWHTFVRDLQADLEDAQPGVTILQVNAFLIRGSGMVDDIKLVGEIQSNDNISVPVDDHVDDGLNSESDNDSAINESDDDGVINDDTEDENNYEENENKTINDDVADDTINEEAEDDATIYEDAEDGTISGWEVYDNISGRAEITNIFDEDRQSRVIKLSGNGFWDGYRLNKADGSNWLNENQFIIQWDMNYSESFYVYLDVETDHGQRHIYYTPVDYDSLGDGAGVHHGLGRDVIDGRWHTFVRDLQADLEDAQPGVTILQVNAFLIRGSGMVDDIKLVGEIQSNDNISVPVDDHVDDGLNSESDNDSAINESDDDGVINDDTEDENNYEENENKTINDDVADDTINEEAEDDATIYEDAEDGTISGWEVYDNISGRAEITNIFDEDRQSRVIKLSGNGFWDGYRLNKADGSNWLNENQFIIQWDMNYSESFYVYLDVETDHGQRHIYYTPVDYDSLGDGAGVHHGLGRDVIDGRWHTFVRDLQADLEDAQPGVTILQVNAFLIRGSGMVDDIKLLAQE